MQIGMWQRAEIVLVEVAQALRRLQEHDLEEVVSTRLLVYCANLLQSGLTWPVACRAAIAEPLSDDEDTVTALMNVITAIMDG